jgi:hypothetical protein
MNYKFSTRTEAGVTKLVAFMVELERQAMCQKYRGSVTISLPDLPEKVEAVNVED